MTDDNDHDRQPDLDAEKLTDEPMDAAIQVASDSARDGRLALAGGGVMLLGALRSLARGQWRTLPKAVVGAGLVAIGLRQQRTDEAVTFEPELDEVDGGTEGKDESDQARAAQEPPVDIDADERGKPIEFADETHEAEDPRQEDDEETEIDLSETETAAEPAEATGPDAEQAQPTQTDSTEPEETPEEDADDKQVEPGEDASGKQVEPDDADETN
jgi:hypothetical protein